MGRLLRRGYRVLSVVVSISLPQALLPIQALAPAPVAAAPVEAGPPVTPKSPIKLPDRHKEPAAAKPAVAPETPQRLRSGLVVKQDEHSYTASFGGRPDLRDPDKRRRQAPPRRRSAGEGETDARLFTDTTITGSVTVATSGSPGLAAQVYAFSSSDCGYVYGVDTNPSTGAYSITIPAGTYKFAAFPASPSYLTTWYGSGGDCALASPVTASGTVSNINIAVAPPPSGSPQAYQPPETEALDSTGHGHDGQVIRGVSLAQPGALTDDADTAMGFGMGNGYVTLPNISLQGAFTVELWMKPSTLAPTWGTLLSKTPWNSRFDLYLDGAGNLVWKVAGASSPIQTAVPSAGVWHHVAASVSGTTGQLFLDGVLAASGTVTPPADGGGDLYVGWNGSADNWYFNGAIDELAIYRSALTATQVQAHYAASGRAACQPSTSSLYRSTVLADSPSGYWRLDEACGLAAADSSGHSLAGVYYTGATLAQAGGLSTDDDKAVRLDGTNGYVGIPSVSLSGTMSVELWMKHTTNGTASEVLVTKAPWNAQWDLLYDGSGALMLRGGDVTPVVTATAPSAGAWHHVVGTIDGTTGKIYIDGSLAATGSVAAIANSSSGIMVGWNGTPGSWHFNGSLDEVALYPTALTAAQVLRHYRAGAGQSCVPSTPSFYQQTVLRDGPAGFWRLDESCGTTAVDSSGKGRDGTLNGSVSQGAAGGLSADTDTATGFNGTSAYVSLPTIDLPGPLSVELWVNQTDWPSWGSLISKQPRDSQFDLLYSGGNLYWQGGDATTRLIVAAPSTGIWHHIVATISGTTGSVYIDGGLAGSGAVSAVGNGSGAIQLAWNGITDGWYFKGALDDVAIYPSALTPAQVLAHYQASSHTGPAGTGYKDTITSDSPEGYWRLNDTLDTTVDTWIGSSVAGATHGSDAKLWVGQSTANGSEQALVVFKDLDKLPQDTVVSSASLLLFNTGEGGGSFTAEAHAATAAWTEANATWSAAPSYDSAVAGSATTSVGWIGLDVTALVRSWVAGDLANNGVRILPASGVTNGRAAFWSSNSSESAWRPTLLVSYTAAPRLGIDAHWTYGPSTDYGGGVSSRVNLTNGNLVVQQGISSVPARGFDVSLSLTYNSSDPYGAAEDSDARDGSGNLINGRFYGNGWTLSHNIRLHEVDSGNGVQLKDGDGTLRVYVKDGSPSGGTQAYKRPLYYDYSLTKDVSGSPTAGKVYRLTQLAGLRSYYFDANGMLSTVEDRNGNKLTYGYSSSGQLTTIEDMAGRQTVLSYSTPSGCTSSPGRLGQVTDMGGAVTKLCYDASGNLTTVTRRGIASTDTGAAVTTFGYDYDRLKTITNPRGHASLVDSQMLSGFDSNVDGWTVQAGCGSGTAAAGWDTTDHALTVTLANAKCALASKDLGTPAVLQSTRADLVSYVYAPSGASGLNAALYVRDRYNTLVQGPSVPLEGGKWNRVGWPTAPVDGSSGVLRVGVQVTAGSAYSGTLKLDAVYLQGITTGMWDAKPVTTGSSTHHLVEQYSYNLAARTTTLATPDTTGTMRNTVYSYSGFGWITQVVDSTGATATMSYDGNGRLTSTTPPPLANNTTAATTRTYWNDGSGNPTNFVKSVTDPTGAITRTGVDTATGDVRYTITPDQEDERRANHAFTATVFTRDSAGNVTEVAVKQYSAEGSSNAEPSKLDASPFPTAIATRSTTTYAYYAGAGGLLKSVTDPLGDVTQYEWDNQTTYNDAQSSSRTKGYLTLYKPPSWSSGPDRTTTYTLYCPSSKCTGQVQQVIDPTSKVSTYEFDDLGRMNKVNHAPGTSIAFNEQVHRDLNGNVDQQTDGNGRTTYYTFDENNRMTQVTDAKSGVTKYDYYDSGALWKRTDAENRVTTFGYDQRNKLTRTTDPLAYVTSYTYDSRGNRLTQTDPANVTSTYSYTQRNELAGTTYSMGTSTPSVSYTYRKGGQRATMVDGTGTTIYSYDDQNRLTATTTPAPSVWTSSTWGMAYEYDARGSQTKVTSPAGDVNYTYLPGGLLSTVASGLLDQVSGSGTYTASYTYDAAGRTSQVTNSGQTTAYHFDDAGRVDQTNSTFTQQAYGQTYPGGATDGVSSTSEVYGYDGVNQTKRGMNAYYRDASGNLNGSGTASLPGTPNFTYDELDRITLGPGVSSTYDKTGNRLTDAASQAYSYDGAGRLATITVGSAPSVVKSESTYDRAGNVTVTHRPGEKVTVNVFDGANRLRATATAPGACSLDQTHTYNGDGLRITSETYCGTTSTSTYRVYDLSRKLPVVLYELAMPTGSNLAAAVKTAYVYGAVLLARAVTNPVTQGNNRSQYYFHDGRRNVKTLITRQSRFSSGYNYTSVTYDEYEYDAFGTQSKVTVNGVLRMSNGAEVGGVGEMAENPYQFQSEPKDPNGTIYLRARYYDPTIGRFLGRDPLPGSQWDPTSQNPYAYAGNNPITRGDPSGMVGIALAIPFIALGVDMGAVGAGLAGAFTGVLAIGAILLSNPYGRHGAPDHQEKVRERTAELEGQGYSRPEGVDAGKERAVDTTGGYKDKRFPDITMEGPNGEPYYENVYRPTPGGEIPLRERQAAEDIEAATGVPVVLTPVDD